MAKRVSCRICSILCAICMVISLFPTSASAVESRQVVERVSFSASACRKAYNAMKEDTSWNDNLALDIGGFLSDKTDSDAVDFVYHVALFIQRTKYKRTMNAFKAGADSGKGCTMLIYDNEVPCVIVNN